MVETLRITCMYHALFFDAATNFLQTLQPNEQAKIRSAADMMRSGDFRSVHIKTLHGPIRELIVQEYRVVFFIKNDVIHFVSAFRKKSAKTPHKEIQRAVHIYKMLED